MEVQSEQKKMQEKIGRTGWLYHKKELGERDSKWEKYVFFSEQAMRR